MTQGLILAVCIVVSVSGVAFATPVQDAEPQNVARSANEGGDKHRPSKSSGHRQPAEPASVRLGLILTNFQKLVTTKDGKQVVRHQPLKELTHTLRARLGRKNHFYIDQYHIETKPMLWRRDTGEI